MNQEQQIIKLLNNMYQFKDYSAILAHGEFPQSQHLQSLIKNAKHLICCDGAIHDLAKINTTPYYIIGDCDSLGDELSSQYQDRIIKIPEQDTNDLTKAVNFAVHKLGLDNLLILGATGIREDHTLANISLLLEYAKMVKQIILISDYGVFSVCIDEDTLPVMPGQQISLFATKSDTKVSSEGLKWELDDLRLDSWYKGTLNQAISDWVTIKSSHPIIIYRAFDIR